MFLIKVFMLKSYMVLFKAVVRLLPVNWPQSFEGEHSSLRLCDEMAKKGHKKILLVTDNSLLQLGLLQPILNHLESLGVVTKIFAEIQPDPDVAQIEAGIRAYQNSQCQALLAIGGGSSIDAAKLIGAGVNNKKPILKMVGLFRVFKGTAPLYVVPTTAGTGSEVTIAAVVSDTKNSRKLAVMDLQLMPTAFALDAKLMLSLPPAITSSTGMDALTHAIESYISNMATAKTKPLSLEAAALIIENLPKAVANGADIKARQNMAKAANLAGKAFTQAGVGYVHAIAHNFGALYHTPHGLANAIVMPYVLDFCKSHCQKRLAEIAVHCGLSGETEQQQAEQLIAHIRQLNKRFDIPETLAALKREDIPRIAKAALKEARFTYAVPKYLHQKSCEDLIAKMLAH